MTRIWPVLSVVLAFMTRILPMVVVVLALLVTGVVHGLWTCRWDQVPDKETVIAPFKNLPLQMGEWEGTDLEASSSEIKGLTGYLSRRYVHPQTKDAVTISLMSGPPRVVAIHTPDVCYAALGYQVNTPARYRATDLPEATEFWTSDMVRTQSTDQNRLRIFWAWNATGAWTASDNPRPGFRQPSGPVQVVPGPRSARPQCVAEEGPVPGADASASAVFEAVAVPRERADVVTRSAAGTGRAGGPGRCLPKACVVLGMLAFSPTWRCWSAYQDRSSTHSAPDRTAQG